MHEVMLRPPQYGKVRARKPGVAELRQRYGVRDNSRAVRWILALGGTIAIGILATCVAG